jgi:hypothetical protein
MPKAQSSLATVPIRRTPRVGAAFREGIPFPRRQTTLGVLVLRQYVNALQGESARPRSCSTKAEYVFCKAAQSFH